MFVQFPNRRSVSSHPNWHDYKRHALAEELPLQREYGEVVEQSRKPRFLGEHELAAEEDGVRETLHDFRRNFVRCLDHVMAHFGHCFSVEILCAHVIRIARGVGADVLAEIFQFTRAFEVAGIDQAIWTKIKFLKTPGNMRVTVRMV